MKDFTLCRLLLAIIAVAVATAETSTSNGDTLLRALNTTAPSFEAEDEQALGRAGNARAARVSLNTLTTSCNGGCGRNAPCVVVGQSPSPSTPNYINCVNDTRCTTLGSGRAALCLDPFTDGASAWAFSPTKANDTAGSGPFERVGLLQLSPSVQNVAFRRASESRSPLASPLDVSSLNLQPASVLNNVTFDGIELTGLEDALPLGSTLQLNIINCNLKAVPLQLISGSSIRVLDLSNNNFTSAPTDSKTTKLLSLEKLDLRGNDLKTFDAPASMFPKLTTLRLDSNVLEAIPKFVFQLTTLKSLSMTNNPLNAATITSEQFAFLASLESFTISGVMEVTTCPDDSVIARLNTSFAFCSSSRGSSSRDNFDVTSLAPSSPPTHVPKSNAKATTSSSSGHNTGLIIGIVLGALAVLGVGVGLWIWYRRYCRENEPTKPTYTSMGSFGGNAVEDLQDHHYHYRSMGYPQAPSNESSEHSSDYEILHTITADGPNGLTRLGYEHVYFDKLLRVSSRSELWLGDCYDETVIIKKIKANTAPRAVMRDFVEEVKLMASLTPHPRIIEFKGALWDPPGTELCAVVEYAENGSLRDSTDKGIQFTVPKQHAISRQIAEALAFLHDGGIVHGRVSAFNILLDRDLSAKLSLFAIYHYVRPSPLDAEVCAFVAPEVLRGQQPTERADVYAFGVVLVELDTRESPSRNQQRRLSMADAPEMQSPTAQRTGFSLSSGCSAMLKDLIAACVDRDPARRPSMAQIAMALRTGAMTL
ncbi:hypothetical protein P43SY_002078 [Pythium insidiosum]|uniref:Protein kinase domain-containing protein n=1 Tax=Pythium insidiosum TaxID=114742 RepID=A0AAD5LRM9_PYTIN|nr:hypothetical protein P43SY_002078 [Pythium insidiosum]